MQSPLHGPLAVVGPRSPAVLREGQLSPSELGYLRAACVVPELRVGDAAFNVRTIVEALREAAADGCQVAVFPELCLTGYSCADLFYQSLLRDEALRALDQVAAATATHDIAAAVGLPFEVDGRLYNCAAFLAGGEVLGLVPKSFLPNTNEFYEERWFTAGRSGTPATVQVAGRTVPFGSGLVFRASNAPGAVFGIEVCEDLWAVQPPSGDMALAGATVLINLSAGNELLGKAGYRRELVRQQSARCHAAYLYSGAGPGESTTDVVFSGHAILAEWGHVLAETARFQFATQMATADIDLERLRQERLKSSVFSAGEPQATPRVVEFVLPTRLLPSAATFELRRPVSKIPFVPSDPVQRDEHCREIFAIQCTGLAKRLRHTGLERVVIGVSGGLDSTLALLVAERAFRSLGLGVEGILCVSMPGFGTTARTRNNASALARALGCSVREIPIRDAVLGHFADIGHDPADHDVTYENAQARERTQILMDLANQVGALVVGTGDLSELALGWCTYNGDQMSMYHVNAGVPKTLVRHLVEWCAEREFAGEASAVLLDIAATPITPELLPLGADDSLQQETEATIGPYELHDFLLFYSVRYAFSPRKIFFLASHAFRGAIEPEEILHWMRVYYQRFFANQFKRSAMPDGPKVGSVALSPRGDWRMPSDASPASWLAELDALAPGLPVRAVAPVEE
jgi:NAD+ synthase (glutamine-hydrolysing)